MRIEISAKTGEGLDRLIAVAQARAADWPGRRRLAADHPRAPSGRARGRPGRACALPRGAGGPELKAEELRIAARHLGRLTGRIDVEEVLGAIFSEFCIGK